MQAGSTVGFGVLLLAGVLGGCATPQQPQTELGYEVGVGHVPGLGTVLVDVNGRTLYVYVPDHRSAPRCTGFCTVVWPALIASSSKGRPHFGPGVDPALVGSVRLPDGARQVTYNGWPMYTFRLDRAPGEATGQGDDMGLWHALSPDGKAIT